MVRLGNERNIIEIEGIVGKDMRPGQDQHSWQASGVDCRRDRHRYSGPHYAFTVDVLDLTMMSAACALAAQSRHRVVEGSRRRRLGLALYQMAQADTGPRVGRDGLDTPMPRRAVGQTTNAINRRNP